MVFSQEDYIERITDASYQVRQTLKDVGSSATYLWPKKGGEYQAWKGYSYEIPKEEQIRSAFWSALQSDEIVCELEWNIYTTEARPKVSGEIDIVGYMRKSNLGLPSLFLEIKRTWNLKGWHNKGSEMLAGIKMDIEKLGPVFKATKKLAKKEGSQIFAGVVVIGFSDQAATASELDIKKIEGSKVSRLWPDVDKDVCFKNERPIYVRADLIILQ